MEFLLKLIDLLLPPRETERSVRETSVDRLLERVAPRHLDPTTTSILPYRTPVVRALIWEAKYRGNERAQELLGSVLASYLLELIGEEAILGNPSYALVPIPLSAKRYKERGYNQAERICQATAQQLGLPVVANILTRTKHTLPQTKLHRHARLSNMTGAFVAESVQGATTYLLIDDVCTTGATLFAARQALLDAGASRVINLSLAY